MAGVEHLKLCLCTGRKTKDLVGAYNQDLTVSAALLSPSSTTLLGQLDSFADVLSIRSSKRLLTRQLHLRLRTNHPLFLATR